MIRKLAMLAALATLATPVLAETGIGTIQIDNVSNVYGRAGVPAVKVVGAVVTRGSDVNIDGRDLISRGAGKTVVSSGEAVDQIPGRS